MRKRLALIPSVSIPWVGSAGMRYCGTAAWSRLPAVAPVVYQRADVLGRPTPASRLPSLLRVHGKGYTPAWLRGRHPAIRGRMESKTKWPLSRRLVVRLRYGWLSTARCDGVPGGLPHGEALGCAAGHEAGSTLAPAMPVARRSAGARSMARWSA